MKKILSYLLIAGASYSGHSQCTTPIAAPWSEGFEFTTFNFPATAGTGLNCWFATGTATNAIWRTNTGFTGSGSTGPSGAFSGSRYAYLETSGVTGLNTDTLWSPPIDLSTLVGTPQLNFKYHMHGLTMGTMAVEIDNGTTTTNIWSISGQQTADELDPWSSIVLDLSAFANDTVRIKFLGTRGTSFTGDMAIDAVGVCSPTFSTINEVACGFYESPAGDFYYESGTIIDTITGTTGCDSIITINLTTNNTTSSQTFSGLCGTYILPSGVVIGEDGTYTDTIFGGNSVGCDSVLTFNLSFNNSTSSISTSDCNSYTAPSGAVYTISGVYSDTIPNAVGCDSIITISLEMFFDNSITVFVTTCGEPYISESGQTYAVSGVFQENYQSINTCDSIVFINVTIATGNTTEVDIEACDEWTSDAGIVYNASGSYDEVYQAISGCDSTRTYNVNINTVNRIANFVSAMTIEAEETGAAYQWVDCNNNNAPMAGPTATNKVFIADFNGDYACEVTKNGCTELTNCVRVSSLSIEDNSASFSVYPNPSNGAFIIELPEVTANTAVTITNTAGQIVYSSAGINESILNVDLSKVEAGMYFISITNENGSAQKAVVIQ